MPPMVAKLAKIGVVPGQDFDAAKLDPAVAKGPRRRTKPAQELIMDWMEGRHRGGDSKLEHGWLFTTRQARTARTTCSARSSPPSASA